MPATYDHFYDRLLAGVAQPDNEQSCWFWARKKGGGGYGRVNVYCDGAVVTLQAHIALWVWLEAAPETLEEFWTAYLLFVASGTELDHTCVNPPCVNPDHQDPVSGSENCLRREARRRGCTVS